MSIRSEAELEALRRAGRVVAETLRRLRAMVRPGVSTGELDEEAAACFARRGARSGPRLDYGYPGTACISVNDEAVHGIPGERVLVRGDLVSLDVTAELDGYYADAAVTVAVPPASSLALGVKACAEGAFARAVRMVRAGVPLWAVGLAVEREVRRRGLHVLVDLSGHGIGRRTHEEPEVPNRFDPRADGLLTEGLVITLEPIVCAGTDTSILRPDRWTVASADGSLTAHHEHTLVVTRGRPLLLTAA